MSKVNGISKRLCVVGVVMAFLVSALASTALNQSIYDSYLVKGDYVPPIMGVSN